MCNTENRKLEANLKPYVLNKHIFCCITCVPWCLCSDTADTGFIKGY